MRHRIRTSLNVPHVAVLSSLAAHPAPPSAIPADLTQYAALHAGDDADGHLQGHTGGDGVRDGGYSEGAHEGELAADGARGHDEDGGEDEREAFQVQRRKALGSCATSCYGNSW